MRARTVILIIGIALLAGFAALNVDEFTRTSVLSLGFTTVQVSLGLVMLLLLVLAIVVFLVTTMYIQSAHLIETRRHARDLNTQRELADKAEASRFTELRTYMDAQSAALLNREAVHAGQFAERLALTQSVLLQRLDQSDNTTAAYMGQMEDRLERGAALMPVRSA